MRRSCILFVLLLTARVVAAQPVRFELAGQVPLGQKPSIKITADRPVSDLRLDLERDDGKHFTAKHGALAKGKTLTLPIGDGAAGKASYKGTLTMKITGGGPWSEELTFETLVRAGLSVTYDADHLDLEKRVLQFKVTRPIAKADLVVIGEDGKELGKGTAAYPDAKPDAWLSISWTQPAKTRVMTMKLRVAAADGAATNVELVPWSVTIDHEDVNFPTDSAVIEATETAKLDASLAKIKEAVKTSERFVKMRLYIAGHTDTVGATAKNRKLSIDRALAIGSYFRKKGISIPIAVAGFGEEVLKVKTADNTDERANRRADYVIGPAAGSPPFKGPYLRVKPDWKQLR